jgi:hypothetical protein
VRVVGVFVATREFSWLDDFAVEVVYYIMEIRSDLHLKSLRLVHLHVSPLPHHHILPTCERWVPCPSRYLLFDDERRLTMNSQKQPIPGKPPRGECGNSHTDLTSAFPVHAYPTINPSLVRCALSTSSPPPRAMHTTTRHQKWDSR